MPTPIALCADDFALTEGVTAGILEAISAGRLMTTSALVNRPGWPAAARAAGSLARPVELGLHLNFTLGAPLTKARRLAPTGAFPAPRRLLAAAFAGALPADEIRAEIVAQLDAFADAAGRAPDFVDGHWHVQVLPTIRRQLLDELRSRGLAGKLWLRDPGDRWSRIAARRVQLGKATLIAALARGFAAEARAAGFAVNDGFAGFSAFDPSRDYAGDFARFLAARGPRQLVMCHPGHVDAELPALDDATHSRERELAFLLSDAFAKLLAAHDLRLVAGAALMGLQPATTAEPAT